MARPDVVFKESKNTSRNELRRGILLKERGQVIEYPELRKDWLSATIWNVRDITILKSPESPSTPA